MSSQYTSPRLVPQSQPYANPSAGPSTAQHRRQSSRDTPLTYGDQTPASGAFIAGTRAGYGQSRNASDEEDRGPTFNLRASMMGADPQTAQSTHHAHSQSLYPGHQHRSPPLPPPPDSQSAPPLPISHSSGPSTSLSPNLEGGSSPRERLPSSSSVSSMSSTQRGRRAPAPAALDLSPRSQRVLRDAAAVGDRYGSLGIGPAPGTSEGLRAVTDSYIDTVRTVVIWLVPS